MKPEVAFGKILKRYRKKATLSQEKLASGSKLDRTYISLLERGLRQPSLTTILQIAKTLNTDPGNLITEVTNFIKNKGK